jgi:hypothetical protein
MPSIDDKKKIYIIQLYYSKTQQFSIWNFSSVSLQDKREEMIPRGEGAHRESGR